LVAVGGGARPDRCWPHRDVDAHFTPERERTIGAHRTVIKPQILVRRG
jgi:hypothetical protein